MSETTIIDDRGVERILPDGRHEQVRWDDLVEVSIVTTDEGPFAEDVYFALVAADGTGCLIPHGAPESKAFLERVQRLPDFNNDAVIEAMVSTRNARFLCWKRAPRGGAASPTAG